MSISPDTPLVQMNCFPLIYHHYNLYLYQYQVYLALYLLMNIASVCRYSSSTQLAFWF